MGKRRTLTGALAMAVALLAWSAAPTAAMAKTEAEAEEEVRQAQSAVDGSAEDVSRIEGEIEGVRSQAESVRGSLPEMRRRASGAMRAIYKASPEMPIGLSIMVEADDFDSLIARLSAVDAMGRDSIGRLVDGVELVGTADSRVEALEAELEQAMEAREEAEGRLAEAEGILARIEDAPPAIEGCEPIDWSLSDDEIVAEWAPRIDAFLAGHALEGHGEDFVRAGILYGVDPRFAAAISMTESTGGDFCFEPFNAFGYLSGGPYSSYSESIYSITEYLTWDYYNARLDANTAKTYCPPTWDSWLSRTLGYAQSI